MVFFKKRGDDVIDLSELYRIKQKQLEKSKTPPSPPNQESKIQTYDESPSSFNFLSNLASSQSNTSSSTESSAISNEDNLVDDKRKRLAKRLIEMTDRIEDLSNQIYHLQQRVEVLERKSHHQT